MHAAIHTNRLQAWCQVHSLPLCRLHAQCVDGFNASTATKQLLASVLSSVRMVAHERYSTHSQLLKTTPQVWQQHVSVRRTVPGFTSLHAYTPPLQNSMPYSYLRSSHNMGQKHNRQQVNNLAHLITGGHHSHGLTARPSGSARGQRCSGPAVCLW